MDFPVREEFRAHVVEVVTLLKMSEVIEQSRIIDQCNLLIQSIQLVERLLLELVAEPCGDIVLLVCP